MARKPGSPPLWFMIAIFAGMAVAIALLAWAFSHGREGPFDPVENAMVES